MRRGSAVVSSHHANFIYNTGGAKSRDILELSLQLRERVWDAFGVWLEYEMEILGTIPSDLQPLIESKCQPEYKKAALDELRSYFRSRTI